MKAAIKIIKILIFLWIFFRVEISLADLRREQSRMQDGIMMLYRFNESLSRIVMKREGYEL